MQANLVPEARLSPPLSESAPAEPPPAVPFRRWISRHVPRNSMPHCESEQIDCPYHCAPPSASAVHSIPHQVSLALSMRANVDPDAPLSSPMSVAAVSVQLTCSSFQREISRHGLRSAILHCA